MVRAFTTAAKRHENIQFLDLGSFMVSQCQLVTWRDFSGLVLLIVHMLSGFLWNSSGRLTRRTWLATRRVSLQYGGRSRLLSMRKARGQSTLDHKGSEFRIIVYCYSIFCTQSCGEHCCNCVGTGSLLGKLTLLLQLLLGAFPVCSCWQSHVACPPASGYPSSA